VVECQPPAPAPMGSKTSCAPAGLENGKSVMHLGALALILVLLAPAIAAQAQQPRKVARIGFLCPLFKPGPPLLALRQGLRELGYVGVVLCAGIANELRFTRKSS
jgi:hypothetical protein